MPGIHHITAVGKDMGFYSEVLGLKLVKKTVNFDDPYTYHIYFGDEIGSPGTALTFFLWKMPPFVPGIGLISTVMYTAGKLSEWETKLKRYNPKRYERFGDKILGFTDPNGMIIELVDKGHEKLDRFYGVAMKVFACDKKILELLGFKETQNEGNTYRFSGESVIDVIVAPDVPPGTLGIGGVHHVAFRAKDESEQMGFRKKILSIGLTVTPQIDRFYFRSIYFRLPSGVLFEIATDGPGFLIDETKNELGKKLMLPKQYEHIRKEIEKHLRPL